MTNKKKSKVQKDGFMKKVSSLFNIDMVKILDSLKTCLNYRLNYAEAVNFISRASTGRVESGGVRAMKLTSELDYAE